VIIKICLFIAKTHTIDVNFIMQVVSYGIVSPLASVIHNIARDSIQCRACRLIGNLAQELCFAEQLHNENITASIVALLDTDSGSSTATRQMAVRALRLVYCNVCNISLHFSMSVFLNTLHTSCGYLILLSLKHYTEQKT
jgi:hypothetical protein